METVESDAEGRHEPSPCGSSRYEPGQDVEPVHIQTFRELRRARRLGYAVPDEPRLVDDFFLDTTTVDGAPRPPRG